MLELGDLFGVVVVGAAELVSDTVGAIAAFLGRLGAVGLVAGLTSPATGGWGIHFLGSSPLASWGPVVICPLAGVLVRSIATSFEHLDHEAERQLAGRLEEGGEPEVAREMEIEEQRRRDLNRQDAAMTPLHTDPTLGEWLADQRLQVIRSGGPKDLGLALLRRGKKRALRMVETSGPISDEVREILTGTWDGVFQLEKDLRKALEVRGYDSAPSHSPPESMTTLWSESRKWLVSRKNRSDSA